MSLQSWHRISLEVNGQLLKGAFDGKPIFEIVDATFMSGFAAIGSGWHWTRYDEFHLYNV
jgi:hypothetical protein